MSAELRGPAFRAALSEAYRELDAICERLAELRVRKEQLEKAVTALQALAEGSPAKAAVNQSAAPAPNPVHEMPPTNRQREPYTDPLQRQISNALGLAALA
jgi:hypothetical protein